MKTRESKGLKVLIRPSLQPAVVFAAISLLMFAQPGRSQDDVAELTIATGTRRALVLVGIPGDAAHEEFFRTTTESLCRWLTEGREFSADNVTVLFGGSQSRPSGAHPAAKEDVKKILEGTGARVTRLAHGLPLGGDLEYADPATLALSLSGRREIEEP